MADQRHCGIGGPSEKKIFQSEKNVTKREYSFLGICNLWDMRDLTRPPIHFIHRIYRGKIFFFLFLRKKNK